MCIVYRWTSKFFFLLIFVCLFWKNFLRVCLSYPTTAAAACLCSIRVMYYYCCCTHIIVIYFVLFCFIFFVSLFIFPPQQYRIFLLLYDSVHWTRSSPQHFCYIFQQQQQQKGDMVEYRLDRGNSTIFELVPDSDEALTAFDTSNVMNCGFTPTFDRYVYTIYI